MVASIFSTKNANGLSGFI